MHQPEKFLSLLDKYVASSITEGEHNELLLLIASGEYDYLLDEHFYSIFHQQDIPGNGLHPQRAQAIIDNIRHSEKRTSRLLPAVFRKEKVMRRRLAAAAVVAVLALAAYWLYPGSKQASPAVLAEKNDLVETVNSTAAVKTLQLEDGSSVALQPGAVLRYPAHFTGGKRDVYLDGEAFFDVTKNPEQPFSVYHHNLVTHVLGTSFYVKVNRQHKQVEVTVVTGTVQVCENKAVQPEQDNKVNGVILTPNQKVVYRESESLFTATLVSDPVPLAPESIQAPVAPPRFMFEDAPLPDVLETLKRTYGIEIVVESNKLNNCLFTGNISKHPLYTKLDIVCASVNASYQVVGTKILIKEKETRIKN